MPDKPEQQTEKQTAKPTALNVRLASRDHADQPVLANYSAAHVAQGIAYLDFGFIEPALLGAVVGAARNGKELPKSIGGQLTARVALPLDALLHLHQQLQQVLEGLRGRRAPQKTETKGQA